MATIAVAMFWSAVNDGNGDVVVYVRLINDGDDDVGSVANGGKSCGNGCGDDHYIFLLSSSSYRHWCGR